MFAIQIQKVIILFDGKKLWKCIFHLTLTFLINKHLIVEYVCKFFVTWRSGVKFFGNEIQTEV